MEDMSAFQTPIHDSYDMINGNLYPQKGMTLRDYFAVHAMQGILFRRDASDLEIKEGQETIADAIAANSYFMADAMLKQRTINEGE